jgi:hypothetical protein
LITLTVAFFLVSQSRDEAVELAEAKDKLATANGLLAMEKASALIESEARRIKAERLAVELRFDQALARYTEDPIHGIRA